MSLSSASVTKVSGSVSDGSILLAKLLMFFIFLACYLADDVVQPPYTAPVPPFSFATIAVWVYVGASPVLFAFGPLTNISFGIRPGKLTISLLFIIRVTSLISSSVRPFEYSFSMHLIIHSLPVIRPPVLPHIQSLSVYAIIAKKALIHRAVCPIEFSISMF